MHVVVTRKNSVKLLVEEQLFQAGDGRRPCWSEIPASIFLHDYMNFWDFGAARVFGFEKSIHVRFAA